MSKLSRRAKKAYKEGGPSGLREFLLTLTKEERDQLMAKVLDEFIGMVEEMMGELSALEMGGADIAGASLNAHNEFEEKVPLKGFSQN
jgi:hypothetical protein